MSMRCNDTRELIGAYIDGELDLVRSLDVEGHMHECSICSREYENHRALHRAIRGGDLYFDTPSGLEKRIRTSLGRNSKSEARPRLLSWRWAAVGTSLAAVALMILAVGLMINRHSGDEAVTHELLSAQIRSLMPEHTLVDVPSSDQHTVKPWFNGKLDFSPPVKDLTDIGFELLGGRLDSIDDRPVAALVYRRGKHIINVFIWPATPGSSTSEETTARRGYNMIRWTNAGMTFWAVSDLNSGELHDFVKAQRQ